MSEQVEKSAMIVIRMRDGSASALAAPQNWASALDVDPEKVASVHVLPPAADSREARRQTALMYVLMGGGRGEIVDELLGRVDWNSSARE